MGNYVKDNCLENDEKILLTVKKSKWCLVFPWILGILGFWLLLIPTITAIQTTILFNRSEYVVTNKHIIKKSGVFSTNVNQIDLDKVQNIIFNQTFWGKIFNYSTITIQGLNTFSISFEEIKNGNFVKRQINEIVDKVKAN